jgi:hypothetical protein
MRRFSPPLFALGFAFGAIGVTVVFAARAYGATGAVPDEVIQLRRVLQSPRAQPVRLSVSTRKAA